MSKPVDPDSEKAGKFREEPLAFQSRCKSGYLRMKESLK